MKRKTKSKGSNWTAAYYQQDPDLAQVVLLLNNSPISKRVIENKSGVTTQCMRNWINGKTKRPYNVTLSYVMNAMGYSRKWTKQ